MYVEARPLARDKLMPSGDSVRAVVAAMAILFSAALNNNALAVFVKRDFITYSQSGWGLTSSGDTPAALLFHNYDSVDAPSGLVEVGIPGTAGFSMIFTNRDDLLSYLPRLGAMGPLNADRVNPTSTASGEFGDELMALRINIDFSDASLLGNLGIS